MKITLIDQKDLKFPDIFKNKKLKLAIVGSRKLNQKEVKEVIRIDILRFVIAKYMRDDVLIISGGAKGVDTFAEEVAEELGIDVLVVKPNYKLYFPKAAPLERNTTIVNFSNGMIAYFPEGELTGGTKNVLEKFKEKSDKYMIRQINI